MNGAPVDKGRQDAFPWRRSTRCGAANTCVEVYATAGLVLVRDSADKDGTTLRFSVGAWRVFLAFAKGQS